MQFLGWKELQVNWRSEHSEHSQSGHQNRDLRYIDTIMYSTIMWFYPEAVQWWVLLEANLRMGWWSGTNTFNSLCGDPTTSTYPNLHRIDFQITTGSDGISDAPFINLAGNFSGRIFVHSPAVTGGFPPKSTQTVSYYVPLDFCQMNALSVHKFTDSWQIERLVLQIDGVTVADVRDPINVANGTPYSYSWAGSAQYLRLCGS